MSFIAFYKVDNAIRRINDVISIQFVNPICKRKMAEARGACNLFIELFTAIQGKVSCSMGIIKHVPNTQVLRTMNVAPFFR